MTQSPLLVEKKCEALRQSLLAMGGQVERALRQSLEALVGHDLALAQEIVAGDREINRQRRVLMQEALVVLAAYQPAGMDLRLAGASLEMIPELERIADYGADIARALLRREELEFPAVLVERIRNMGEAAIDMLHDAMAAYAQAGGDEAMARAVAARDDRVDALDGEVFQAVVELIREDPESAATGVSLCWIGHLYERVADRATNIAESVVYIATAQSADLD